MKNIIDHCVINEVIYCCVIFQLVDDESAYCGSPFTMSNVQQGQDVNSTFSSDSGNVADYYESNERGALHPLPKSRSMPEYMENYAGMCILLKL